MKSISTKRKLVDLSETTIKTLSCCAKVEGKSLKKYIESILDKEAERARSEVPDSVTDARIISLVGIIRMEGH